MSLESNAHRVLDAAQHEEARADEWLTVKDFALRVNMSEHAVREAIRKRRLSFRVERLTTGPKGAIRIILPRPAA